MQLEGSTVANLKVRTINALLFPIRQIKHPQISHSISSKNHNLRSMIDSKYHPPHPLQNGEQRYSYHPLSAATAFQRASDALVPSGDADPKVTSRRRLCFDKGRSWPYLQWKIGRLVDSGNHRRYGSSLNRICKLYVRGKNKRKVGFLIMALPCWSSGRRAIFSRVVHVGRGCEGWTKRPCNFH